MNQNTRDQQDFEFLMENARVGRGLELEKFLHLDQPVGIWNYIRIANEIAGDIPPGRLLDWGCGLGQMTYLLQRRGFTVTAFDIGAEGDSLPDIPLAHEVQVVRTKHPTALPFPDASFDVVLSCGVLEHVDEFSQPGNERLSLREIHRVLRPRGYFPIYQLPQQYTWQEAITRVLKLGYSHPRRFTAGEARRILDETGFQVERLKRNNLFPKNLTGLPQSVRDIYSRFARGIIAIDELFSRIPVVNQVAGVLEIMARRRP